MKLVLFADLHARVSNPSCRKDDFCETIKDKFLQIMDIASDEGASYILQAGDFFDDARQPYRLTNWFLNTITDAWVKIQMLGVAGQHDQVNHTLDITNTPYKALVSSRALVHLGGTPMVVKDLHGLPDVAFYGRSWGEQIPKIQDKSKFNILVIHETITQTELYAGQKNPILSKEFLKEHQFNLIVAGDYHVPYTEHYRGRSLVMCGSVARLTVEQAEYKPCVWVFDTKTQKLKKRYLKLKCDIDTTIHTEKKEDKQRLAAFIQTLDVSNITRNYADRILEESKNLKGPRLREEISSIIAEATE